MMSKQRKILHFKPSIVLNVALLIFVSSNSVIVSHYTDFVYKKCQNETHLPDDLVSPLVRELLEKSSESKFYQTNTGDDTFAVSGMFQCRGDLTNGKCHNCIMNTLRMLSCGSTFPTRVQLKGCYTSLEPESEPPGINTRVLVNTNTRKDYLQHKKCGKRSAWFKGLREVSDEVFEAVARCIMSSADRYCETRLKGLYAMGQCEGVLGECECGECVSKAFQVAQDECWGSDSGEVYLENCFVSFRNDESKEGRGNSFQENSVGGGSGKLVAIVVGVGVALVLLFALCYCIRSSKKKQDDW